MLTLTADAPSIDAGTGDEHVVDDGEDTLTTDPTAMLILDATVRQHGGLVELDASSVYVAGKRHLVGMEILEARLAHDVLGLIAQDVGDGV